MIVAVSLTTALVLRLACGRPLRALSDVHVKGEVYLIALIVAQAGLPLLAIRGPFSTIAFWLWVSTFPCMIAVAWMNRRIPGVLLIGAGLCANLVVITLNAGMPVSGVAAHVAAPSRRTVAVPSGDFVHRLADERTRLVMASDVIPAPGFPDGGAVASAGDVLMLAGLATAIAMIDPRHVGLRRGSLQV